MERLSAVMGPRIPGELLRLERKRFLLPSLFLGGAGIFLMLSVFFPYWGLTLDAPQYPDGLRVKVYLNRVSGDVREIDGLNHYIGMRPLDEAAPLEKSLSLFVITGFALLLWAAIFIHSPWVTLLVVIPLLFPAIFLGDMYYWLWDFGTHLDPKAPLSSSVEPFVPPLLGTGMVGQFKTISYAAIGFYAALMASLFIIIGLYLHRRAFKPLYNTSQEEEKDESINTA